MNNDGGLEPPSLSAPVCKLQDDEACVLCKGLQIALKDTTDLLSVINRIMTAKRLKQTPPSEIEIPAIWLNEIKGASVSSNFPQPEAITAVGTEWFSDTVARLELRKLQSNSSDLKSREKRWISAVLSPELKLANMAFSGDISKVIFIRLLP